MLTKKKKIIIVASMAILLVVSGYLNIRLNNNVTTTSTTTTASMSIFESYRTNRTSTRNTEISYYDAIIASASTTEEARLTAETNRANLISMMDKELVAESLIKAQGFDDAFITTSTNLISCVVKSADLTSSQVAKIYTILHDQLGANLSNVEIIPVE